MAGEPGRRRWLRPLGLLALALILAIGQPSIVIVVTFAALTFLAPGAGVGAMLLAAAAFALVFAGEPGGSIWYLERGWAILVGGSFVAASLARPHQPFLHRGLVAVLGGTIWAALLLVVLGGWPSADGLLKERIRIAAGGTLDLMATFTSAEVSQGLSETMAGTAEVQGVLFPALAALSTLASLGVAWWLHLRVAAGSDRGLGALRHFRFPDPLIWVLIAGLLLVVAAEWSVGWGRVGSNLLAFMGALYMIRGAGVLLFLTGGLSATMGILLAGALVLAGPLILAGTLVVGVGDSWFDLRARVGRDESGGTG